MKGEQEESRWAGGEGGRAGRGKEGIVRWRLFYFFIQDRKKNGDSIIILLLSAHYSQVMA